MADTREVLLARLVTVCGAVEGVQAAGRNVLDVSGLARPAVLVQDGIEEVRDIPPGARHTEIARMELTPDLTVIVRGGNGGGLLSLYRKRVLAAVLGDAELMAATGRNGGIRYSGCIVAPPDPEGREYRIDLTLVFSYVFKLDDLLS